MITGVSLTIVSLVFVLCFLPGLAWTRFRRVPLIATAVVLPAFVVYLARMGMRASHCWNCDGEAGRGIEFLMTTTFGWIIPAVLIGTIWAGALLGLLFRVIYTRKTG